MADVHTLPIQGCMFCGKECEATVATDGGLHCATDECTTKFSEYLNKRHELRLKYIIKPHAH